MAPGWPSSGPFNTLGGNGVLTSLSIRNIVLIDKLDLSFEPGLTVLTGETGAGKSILLDSLGLALGARADRALVRSGTESGTVTAVIEIPDGHTAWDILRDADLDVEPGEDLIVRRQVSADGRSKAWVNDAPVSRGILAALGDSLVEIHGQHDDRGLLDAAAHRGLLDTFGGYDKQLMAVKQGHKSYQDAKEHTARTLADLQDARADEEFTRHAHEELAALGPILGEEEQLAERRALMMQGERASKDLAEFEAILTADEGVAGTVRGILRRVARMDTELADLLAPMSEALDSAAEDLYRATDILADIQQKLDFNPAELEAVEERLFEYRRLARKHNCQPNDLVSILDGFSVKLEGLDGGDAMLTFARQEEAKAREKFIVAVEALSLQRQKVAADLDVRVNAELPPLKLEKAVFRTLLDPIPEDEWNASGGERVVFEVKTNAGTDFGPMVKVASGGELARLILALKVVLAENGTVPVMVFDEVDRGIGGATASAVGQRLAQLSKHAQVLVVTHSPQVAARGKVQYQIQKRDMGETTTTTVQPLSDSARREEIARMLSGAEINDAARGAADQLLAANG